jgi:Mn2+/Fe2+ NRAMP family transporter
MVFSNLTAIFIVIATAATLHRAGITEIDSAVQAAWRYGRWPETSPSCCSRWALSAPACSLSGAGRLGRLCRRRNLRLERGLDRRLREAKAFYAVIALATAAGIALNLLAIDPMHALYWAAVVNGLLAPPLMVVTMLIARNPRVMGAFVISPALALGGWLSTAVMAAVALLFLLA